MRPLAIAILVFLACSLPADAGIRGPGPYSGVVFVDRWDTCYLISGNYLMYPVGELAENLRPHLGQSISLYANSVLQPRNPGDGFLLSGKVTGAPDDAIGTPLRPLSLQVEVDRIGSSYIDLALFLANQSDHLASAGFDRIAPTVIRRSTHGCYFPAAPHLPELASYAAVTRYSLDAAEHVTDGCGTQVSWRLLNPESERVLDLSPHETRVLRVRLTLSDGEYELLFAMANGVHSGYSLISNSVTFDVLHQEIHNVATN